LSTGITTKREEEEQITTNGDLGLVQRLAIELNHGMRIEAARQRGPSGETAHRKCIRHAQHDLRELNVTRWRGKGYNIEGWVFVAKR
jgi:hypothetical protein